MNLQAMKNQTSTLHCKPQSCRVLTESKAKISVTLIGDSSKSPRYTCLTFRGPALNARLFQENQNSKHPPHIWKPQPDEELPLPGGLCQSPTPGSVSRERGSELFQSPSLPGQRLRFSLPALSSSGPSVLCPQGSQTSDRSRQTLAGQEIVGACWIWKNSFLAENRFSSKCQGRGGVKMIHKFKHIF